MNKLGEFIRNKRRIEGLSLQEFADKVGISVSQLSKIERGESQPKKETIEKFSEPISTTVDDLLMMAGYLPGDGHELFQKTKDSVDKAVGPDSNKILQSLIGDLSYAVSKQKLLHTAMLEAIGSDSRLSPKEVQLLVSELESFYIVRLKSMMEVVQIKDDDE